MRIIIHQRSMVISDALRARIEKKLAKLDRFFDEDIEVTVKMAQERGGRETVELTLNMDGTMLRAEEVSSDIHMSFDRAIDKLVRQIRKHRTKFEKRLRAGAFDQAEPEVDMPDEAEERGRLVRVKRFAMKPMAVEDAIAQMDMLGHSFFLFLNAESGSTCLVYKRYDGDVGMLEPTNM